MEFPSSGSFAVQQTWLFVGQRSFEIPFADPVRNPFSELAISATYVLGSRAAFFVTTDNDSLSVF